MATLVPPQHQPDTLSDQPPGDGLLAGAILALCFAIAALALGFLIIYATFFVAPSA